MGDDYTLDDMFMTASATKGMSTAAEKRIKDKASQGKTVDVNGSYTQNKING